MNDSLSNNYKQIVDNLLAFSVGEASMKLLPQNNYISSVRMNNNKEIIQSSIKDLYVNIRELEDAKDYIKYYVENEIKNKTIETRKLIKEIHNFDFLKEDNKIIQSINFEGVRGDFKDRNGIMIPTCSVLDNKLIPLYYNLYNVLVDDIRVNRYFIPYKATNARELIKNNVYRTMYLFNSPEKEGVSEEISFKFKTPEIINNLSLSLNSCSIKQITTIDTDNISISYDYNQVNNINPTNKKIKEVIVEIESTIFKTIIYEKDKLEKDFLISVEEGLERKKIKDDYDRYNKSSLYLIEELLEGENTKYEFKNNQYYEREFEESFESLTGKAKDPEVDIMYQYVFGINSISFSFKESKTNSYFLSYPIKLNNNTKKVELKVKDHYGDGSLEYFLIYDNRKIEIPTNEIIKNEMFFRKLRFNSKKVLQKQRNKKISNDEFITYLTEDKGVFSLPKKEEKYKYKNRKFINNYHKEEYDDGVFYGELTKYNSNENIKKEESKFIKRHDKEYYSDKEGYEGRLSKVVDKINKPVVLKKFVEKQKSENYSDKEGFKGKLTKYKYKESYPNAKLTNLTKEIKEYDKEDYSDKDGFKGKLTKYLHSENKETHYSRRYKTFYEDRGKYFYEDGVRYDFVSKNTGKTQVDKGEDDDILTRVNWYLEDIQVQFNWDPATNKVKYKGVHPTHVWDHGRFEETKERTVEKNGKTYIEEYYFSQSHIKEEYEKNYVPDFDSIFKNASTISEVKDLLRKHDIRYMNTKEDLSRKLFYFDINRNKTEKRVVTRKYWILYETGKTKYRYEYLEPYTSTEKIYKYKGNVSKKVFEKEIKNHSSKNYSDSDGFKGTLKLKANGKYEGFAYKDYEGELVGYKGEVTKTIPYTEDIYYSGYVYKEIFEKFTKTKYKGYVYRKNELKEVDRENDEFDDYIQVGVIIRDGYIDKPYVEKIELIEYVGDYYE